MKFRNLISINDTETLKTTNGLVWVTFERVFVRFIYFYKMSEVTVILSEFEKYQVIFCYNLTVLELVLL